jgi:hypothetical protein
MVRHRANDAGGELHFVNVTECFFDEHYAFAVVGEIGALAEPSHSFDVRRQVFGGILAFLGSPFLCPEDGRGRKEHTG